MESTEEIAHFVNTQLHGDVFLQRPEPMSLALPCKRQSLVPEPMRNSIREAGYNGLGRQMMSLPIPSRADSVDAAAVRTPPALEPQRLGKTLKIAKYEPMPPNTGTAAPLHKTLLRPRKGIPLSQPENLIDTHH